MRLYLKYPSVGSVYQVRSSNSFQFSPYEETSWLRPDDACEISRDSRTPSDVTGFTQRDSGAPLVIHTTEGDKLLGVGSHFSDGFKYYWLYNFSKKK